MTRFLVILVLMLVCDTASLAAVDPASVNSEVKKVHPPHPEQGGLRVEVNSSLSDSLQSDGKTTVWGGAYFVIEIALHNISAAPITVPTSYYEGKPRIVDWPGWGEGTERVIFSIEPPTFEGKVTTFSVSRFCPVVLAPGAYVLIMRHGVWIQDRKHADAIKEASVYFGVSNKFAGKVDWWSGNLQAYATIQRTHDPDKEIQEAQVAQKRYEAEKEAELETKYGERNAARVAAMIAECDQAEIGSEQTKDEGAVVVHDHAWIKNVSEIIAAGKLPVSRACFCTGWRTAKFTKNGAFLVSLAAIHGNQLRIHWLEGGGDYKVEAAYWEAVTKALEYPAGANHPAEPVSPGRAGSP